MAIRLNIGNAMAPSSHSVAEWLEHRPLIEHLYSERNLTMDQIRDHLGGIGFHVKYVTGRRKDEVMVD